MAKNLGKADGEATSEYYNLTLLYGPDLSRPIYPDLSDKPNTSVILSIHVATLFLDKSG
jgi:hypothetical protein